jgi:hypothetical protein
MVWLLWEGILQDVKEVFTPLVEQANKVGSEINKKKYKIYDNITKALQ